MFDEAFAEMRTAGIDALAAPVGERGGAVAAEERGEPAGKVAADHVAVAAVGGPARDELREDRGAARKAALQRILEVEQAEIIFAPLAHDDLFAVRRGVGIEPLGLAR